MVLKRRAFLHLDGKDKHGNLIYYLRYRDQAYGFVGRLDDIAAFLDAERENHHRSCADSAVLRQGGRDAAVAVAHEVGLKVPRLVDDVEMDQR